VEAPADRVLREIVGPGRRPALGAFVEGRGVGIVGINIFVGRRGWGVERPARRKRARAGRGRGQIEYLPPGRRRSDARCGFPALGTGQIIDEMVLQRLRERAALEGPVVPLEIERMDVEPARRGEGQAAEAELRVTRSGVVPGADDEI